MTRPAVVRLVVPGIPRSGKNSAQIVRAGARRFVRKSKAAAAWLMDAREAYAKQFRGRRLLTGPLSVHIAIYQPHPLPDGDNVQNLVWDSLKQVVIGDDAQFVRWSGEKIVGAAPHRVEVEVRAV